MSKFAQDPIRIDSLAPLLARIAQEPRWYALVDTAFDYLDKTPYALPQGSLNCYAESMLLGALAPAAPVLVPLGGAGVDIQALLAHCDGRPMLSFLRLAEGIDATELIKQWDPLHWVSTPDGDRYLLRFADTHILTNLSKVLTVPQYAAWHNGIAEWHFINREGMLRKLVLPQDIGKPVVPIDPVRARYMPPPKPQKIELAKKISFDNEHFAIAVDCGEPDAVLNFLNENVPGTVPEDMPGSECHRHAEAAIGLARRAGVENEPDKTSLVVIAVGSKGRFLQMPELEPFLKAKNWEPGKLAVALKQETWALDGLS
jgi:hypothetical protein